jgi:hypothetical protein
VLVLGGWPDDSPDDSPDEFPADSSSGGAAPAA